MSNALLLLGCSHTWSTHFHSESGFATYSHGVIDELDNTLWCVTPYIDRVSKPRPRKWGVSATVRVAMEQSAQRREKRHERAADAMY